MKKLLIGLAFAAAGSISGIAIAYTTNIGINSVICKPGTDHCFQCVESGGQEWCRHCEGTKCSTWLPKSLVLELQGGLIVEAAVLVSTVAFKSLFKG